MYMYNGVQFLTAVIVQNSIYELDPKELDPWSLLVTSFYVRAYISVANRQNPFPLILVKNELRAFSESLGPPGSRPHPIMTIAGL